MYEIGDNYTLFEQHEAEENVSSPAVRPATDAVRKSQTNTATRLSRANCGAVTAQKSG